jgi:ABC-type multidrug transport system fused ATPase/permease subunit
VPPCTRFVLIRTLTRGWLGHGCASRQAKYVLVDNTPILKGKLRVASLKSIGRMPQEMVDVLDEASILSLLDNDISRLQGCISSMVGTINNGLRSISSTAMLLSISPIMGGLAVLLAIINAATVFAFNERISASVKELQGAEVHFITSVHAALASTRLRKLFGIHERLDAMIAATAGKAGKAGKRVRRVKAAFGRALQACSQLGVMAIFLSGVALVA